MFPLRCNESRVGNLFYLYNFNPELWPCGNPEAGYLDTDKSPTKTEILNRGKKSEYWQACFDFRPQQELYNVDKDPNCMNNLAQNPEYQGKMAELKKQLFDRLKAEGDPYERDAFPLELTQQDTAVWAGAFYPSVWQDP